MHSSCAIVFILFCLSSIKEVAIGLTLPTTVKKSASMTKNMTMKKKLAIHWFRSTGLRFHDNPSLSDACKSGNTDLLLPIVIIDPDLPFANKSNIKPGCIRVNFILESLHELNTKFQKIQDNKQRLVVIVGKPKQVLPEIIETCFSTTTNDDNDDSANNAIDDITLYYERDPAEPIRKSDSIIFQAIQDKLKHKGNNKVGKNFHIKGYDSHTLHPMEHYVSHCKDHVAPSTYGGFLKIFSGRMGKVAKEVDTVTSCPPPLPISIMKLLETKYGNSGLTIPTLEELGYDPIDLQYRHKGDNGIVTFIGGEDVGLELLKKMMERTNWVCTFEKPKTKPNALNVDTTGLSPYVKHGCISIRKFYHELSKVYEKGLKSKSIKLSKPPVSLHGQLLWREYNYLMGYTTPNFDKMVGNPIARQIQWDDDPMLVEKWKLGQTGYPYIDSIMIQLKQTGYIHHLARHSTACFLTRGDLYQSWIIGANIFEEYLIDADWSINNFNWQVRLVYVCNVTSDNPVLSVCFDYCLFV